MHLSCIIKIHIHCCVDYITADLLSQAADFERLESLVDKTQQDKRRLGVRVNRLTQTGELLVINILLSVISLSIGMLTCVKYTQKCVSMRMSDWLIFMCGGCVHVQLGF